MLSSYEVKEYIDHQELIISNLQSLIGIMTYKQRIKDEKLSRALRDILNQIMQSSFSNGPEDETWPDWKKFPVKKSIKYFCDTLKIDIKI